MRTFKSVDNFHINNRGTAYVINLDNDKTDFEELRKLRASQTEIQIDEKVGKIVGIEDPMVRGCTSIILG